MDEVLGKDGSWTFDLETLRITPSHSRGVHKLRQAIGELSIPLEAINSVVYEPGRKGGKLRLRLRDGADPLHQVTAGRLSDNADPYQLAVDANQVGTSQYFAEAVRTALMVHQVPSTPVTSYLLPPQGVPITATAGDGTATFDGEKIRLDWSWMAEDSKSAPGPVQLALSDVTGVEWQPQKGVSYGFLRFRTKTDTAAVAPEHDRHCLSWGIQREGGTTVLVAAAVLSRLPHPSAARELPEAAERAKADDDPDAMLRRLRELGELHKSGILTDEEFAAAKRKFLGL
ncbi:DUF4429 domain-containing protein [Kibdelosporangium philippinense]|uniref:DUF4429 domain-containing protein n=1 Tax=Kibdelosporangium philippinense TaxID=211113 RepID=A0ABS8ZIV4_9PSEU|nr:DUF4429 domain-containing protein [Kibdelosporangium philippinense]MCE7006880.1 DUF4429 domain-containing protein [Kibdelosporangium philippinense]